MQPRAGSQPKPSSPICPNCHVQLSPGTQICPNCKARICTHCYQVIPSLTARVCPNCGKPEVLRKPIKDMLAEAEEREGSADYFESETEYKCPHCQSNLSLRSSRRLICKNCGFITSLDEYLSLTRKANPIYDARSTIASKERISSRIAEPVEHRRTEQYAVPEKLTTNFEAKADNQKWWRGKGLSAGALPVKSSKKTAKAKVYTRESGSSFGISRRSLITGFRVLALIIVLGLLAYGIYRGFDRLISYISSSNLPSSISVAKPELTITSVAVDSTVENGAMITWITDAPATSQVEYGLTPALGNNRDDQSLVTEHSIGLSNLEADATYYYKVISKAKDGRTDFLESQFKTLAPPDTVPPVISGIKVSAISDIEAEITWVTDENTYSVVDYGTSTGYANNAKVNSNPATQHMYKLTALSPETTYHFRITSFDASDNKAQSQDVTFKTLKPVQVGYELYNRAPDFTLQGLDGKTWTLSELRSKVVMINFWNLSCGPCKAELPYIKTVYETWQGDKPLQLLTINLMDYEIHLENAVAENGYTFPILLDETGDVSHKYGIAIIPMTFFVDGNGIIQKVQRGRFNSADEITEILNSL